jgi:class 3 adenylate cyclase
MPNNGQPVTVRIGIHSGPITSGIVGYRMPKFCLFGDTMNTASRMETTCPHGCIQVSDATQALLSLGGHAGQLVSTGGVEVKGKGRMVRGAVGLAGWTCQEALWLERSSVKHGRYHATGPAMQ